MYSSRRVPFADFKAEQGGAALHIAVLGSDNFAPHLRALGASVFTCGPRPEADIPLSEPDADWEELERLLKLRGVAADAVLVTDDVGWRKLPTGLWAADAVTVFYGMDAPLNRFWQMPYARLFDLALLDQRQESRDLAQTHAGAHWLPVGIELSCYLGEHRRNLEPGVCFVGVVDPKVRPKRSALLQKLERLAPLTVRGGRQSRWYSTHEAARLYRSHQVMINENLFPGVTTRPLEGMASGGCVLSEAAPGDMDGLFTDGEHLAYFDPENLEEKLKHYLGDVRQRNRVAQMGRAEVHAKHGLQHRASDILNYIQKMASTPPSERPRAQGGEALRLEGEALFMAGLRWPGKVGGLRVVRGGLRMEEAAADGADPLAAARGAGLVGLVLGRGRVTLDHFRRAAEAGVARDRLVWALAAWANGDRAQAGEAIAGLPGVAGSIGEASFHLKGARLLCEARREISIGFNRRGLPPCFWSATEHLLEAVRLEPKLVPAWELMGDIMLNRGAPNQAHDAYVRALELGAGSRVEARAAQAAKEGYLL